jgi:hypothetical protein
VYIKTKGHKKTKGSRDEIHEIQTRTQSKWLNLVCRMEDIRHPGQARLTIKEAGLLQVIYWTIS